MGLSSRGTAALSIPAGQVASGNALGGAVIRVALDGGLVVLLPQEGVVLVDEQQLADDEEEHLGVFQALRGVPGAGDLVDRVAAAGDPVVLLVAPRTGDG